MAEAVDWLVAHWDDILIIIGSVGVACEGTILALRALVGSLRGLAKMTPTKRDDDALATVYRALTNAALWVEQVHQAIPRLRTNGTSRKGRASTALVLALVVMSGCGGRGLDIAQQTAAGGAIAVTAVDPVIADAYQRAIADFEAGVITPEAYHAKMVRLDRAERALRSLSHALMAVDYAVASYEDGRECGVKRALSAASRAAHEVVEALDAAGVDIPSRVYDVIEVAAGLLQGDAFTCGEEAVA